MAGFGLGDGSGAAFAAQSLPREQAPARVAAEWMQVSLLWTNDETEGSDLAQIRYTNSLGWSDYALMRAVVGGYTPGNLHHSPHHRPPDRAKIVETLD
jgi:hypothetical protein